MLSKDFDRDNNIYQEKNVLQLSSGVGNGGAGKILFDTFVQLEKNNRINSAVIFFSNENVLSTRFNNNEFRVILLSKNKSLKFFFEILSFSNSFVKSENIDIIHAHMFHAMLIAAVLKIRNPKIKVVFTSHNVNLGSRLRNFLIFLLKPFRDIDILFSPNMKRYFHKSHNTVIQNAVNSEEFKGQTDKFEKFTFLAVGHLREAKNYPFLLKCVRDLKKSFDFQLLIAGEGKLRQELQNIIQKEKLEKHVFLLDNVENIPELLQQSHCLVMPSLWEGMPLAILEAGTSRLPVIATPVGSVSSMLNEKYGYLATLDEFCEKMADVYYHYSDAQERADHFYDQVTKEYTIEKMAKKLEDLYLSL